MLPEFIYFVVPEGANNNSNYILHTVAPYTIAKVVKISSQQVAETFYNNDVSYPIIKIDGVNVFLVHKGYLEDVIQDYADQMETVQKMATFYNNTVLVFDKRTQKRYKTT